MHPESKLGMKQVKTRAEVGERGGARLALNEYNWTSIQIERDAKQENNNNK